MNFFFVKHAYHLSWYMCELVKMPLSLIFEYPLSWKPSQLVQGWILLQCKGHFTHKIEGPWPLQCKSSHWLKGTNHLKFISHKEVKDLKAQRKVRR